MGLSLSKKLMLAFIGLTLVVLTATLSLARWSFERGFLDYTNALEQQRLLKVAENLSQLYRSADKNWQQISRFKLEQNLFGEPIQLQEMPPKGLEHRPPRNGPFGPPPHLLGQSGPPTALLSPNGELIAGTAPTKEGESWIRVPVKDGDTLVAELVSAPRRQLESAQETAFSQQQWLTSIVIGLFSLCLALIASLVLTRRLLAPVRRMAKHVSKMSKGDYQARLEQTKRDELGQLMSDLDRLAETLEQNQSSRQRWLADISHELRTPVTVLSGELTALQDGIRPLEMEQIYSLAQEVERLRHLIDDLYQLSVSDVGGLKYNFKSLDLSECLQTSVHQLRNQALEKGLELKLGLEVRVIVNGDKQRLLQLFANLLNNAMAYTDAPGEVQVQLATLSDRVEITIEDSPPGVDANECEKLFEPLYRQEASRSRRTAGAGLGLSICRNIVQAHQGEISAAPSKLGGLAVKVSLPLPKETLS